MHCQKKSVRKRLVLYCIVYVCMYVYPYIPLLFHTFMVKTHTSVSIDSDTKILAMAKGINLSETLQHALELKLNLVSTDDKLPTLEVEHARLEKIYSTLVKLQNETIEDFNELKDKYNKLVTTSQQPQTRIDSGRVMG